ncbi:MAG: hypothetical protein ACSHX7_05040 [Luteolibacter sp.]
MKFLILAITLLQPLFATGLSLRTVKQPLFLVEADQSTVIKITDVPFITYYSDPEWRFSAISQPFIPSKDSSWETPHDINLTSLYGISVLGTYKDDSNDFLVTIDASKAKAPEAYPFTIEQVIDSVQTCVKLMYPTVPKEEGVLIIKIINPANESAE